MNSQLWPYKFTSELCDYIWCDSSRQMVEMLFSLQKKKNNTTDSREKQDMKICSPRAGVIDTFK